jgi:hypothetical protein
MAGDAAAVERKLGDMAEFAEKLMDQREHRSPWLYWMSPQFFRCLQGVALGLLADERRYRQGAIRQLQAGYAALPQDQRTSSWAAIYLTHLASVHTRAGDAEQACATALEAAPIARRTGSVRLAGMLAEVRAGLVARWPDDARVTELSEALR